VAEVVVAIVPAVQVVIAAAAEQEMPNVAATFRLPPALLLPL
jgi:hypothetical protein